MGPFPPHDSLITQTNRPPGQIILSAVLPFATLLFALVFGLVPLVSTNWAIAVPDFLTAVLFFWCVYRPKSVPILLVFGLGGLGDMLHGSPIGSQTLAYMFLVLVTKTQAQYLRSLGFLVNWGFFALVMVCVACVKLGATMLGTVQAFDYPVLPAFLRSLQLILTTIIFYPAFHLVLGALNRLLIQRLMLESGL